MDHTKIDNGEITPEFFGEPVQYLLTIPKEKPSGVRNKIPITLFLSKNGASSNLDVYVYSINDVSMVEETIACFYTNQYKSSTKAVYTSTLQACPDERLLDFARRVSQVISRKFQCPSFVGVSGPVGTEESVEYIKGVLEKLDNAYKSENNSD